MLPRDVLELNDNLTDVTGDAAATVTDVRALLADIAEDTPIIVPLKLAILTVGVVRIVWLRNAVTDNTVFDAVTIPESITLAGIT